MASEQAKNMVTKLQSQMDETKAGADPKKVPEDDEESEDSSD